MSLQRVIFHVDMDAFFAAIEQLDQPELKGRPVLIGHDGPRGVVATASYEARPFGCHSAQPIAVAKRLCPNAIVVPVRGARYREVSQQMFSILESFSPLVEPLSIDEAFMDLSGAQRLLGPPRDVAHQLKDRIVGELGLTASVGVAPNKFLAKLASDLEKPNGLTVVEPDLIDGFLAPLPIDRMWGLGPVGVSKLEAMGVRTFGDLRSESVDRLRSRVGDDADRLLRLANGIDNRPVTPDHEAKSISHEQTFGANVADVAEVRRVLIDQVENVARRVRRHGFRARTVTIKIRYGQFETITRSMTLKQSTDSTATMLESSLSVFDRWAGESFQPVRLIGMGATQFNQGEPQLDLFIDPEKERQHRIDVAADQIIEKFGKRAVRRGGTIE